MEIWYVATCGRLVYGLCHAIDGLFYSTYAFAFVLANRLIAGRHAAVDDLVFQKLALKIS